jgi:hypothetical protein
MVGSSLAELPIPAAISAAGLIAPVSVALPSSDAAHSQSELTQRLNLIEIGQTLPAQIQSQLADGSYLVQIANTVVQMQLPQGTPVGSTYTATLIGNNPRPTFLLQDAVPTAAQQSSETSLSSTAHLITTLLQMPENAATPLTAATPVVPQPTMSPNELAAALKTSLAQSGLFYEAHLSQWIQGQRTLASIQQEPQASQTQQLVAQSNMPASNSANTQQSTQNPSYALATGSTSNSQPALANLSTSTSANTPINTSANASANASANDIQNSNTNPVLTQLVQHQLQTLENGQILWQGQVWPGQTMQWQIENDQSPSPQSSAQESAGWKSQMLLDMPALGQMNIQIGIVGKQVRIAIHTDSSQTCATLSSQQTTLLTQLTTVGLKLDHLQIQQTANPTLS